MCFPMVLSSKILNAKRQGVFFLRGNWEARSMEITASTPQSDCRVEPYMKDQPADNSAIEEEKVDGTP